MREFGNTVSLMRKANSEIVYGCSDEFVTSINARSAGDSWFHFPNAKYFSWIESFMRSETSSMILSKIVSNIGVRISIMD